jgi:hypothetical protein
VDDAYSLYAGHADPYKGDYTADYELPEGFALADGAYGEPLIFRYGSSRAAELVCHRCGLPQLVDSQGITKTMRRVEAASEVA